jgi:hypothetical protein
MTRQFLPLFAFQSYPLTDLPEYRWYILGRQLTAYAHSTVGPHENRPSSIPACVVHRFSSRIVNGGRYTVAPSQTPYVWCIISYMTPPTSPLRPFGPPSRGITQSDVNHAADTLLRLGERPTIDKVRAKIGKGSPNTINPLLDAWWKTLSARVDSGPAALHRLPETVAHVAEALWMQALEEGKRRVLLEQRDSARVADLDKQRLEVRSHVLTLREGELDSRLRDRDRAIDDLNRRLRELTTLLRKEQATCEFLSRQLAELQSGRTPKGQRSKSRPKARLTKRFAVRNKSTARKRKLPNRRRHPGRTNSH